MASDKLIYYRAERLIEQHGSDAMKEANRLLRRALERREQDLTLVARAIGDCSLAGAADGAAALLPLWLAALTLGVRLGAAILSALF